MITDSLGQDFRFACRRLWVAKTFTAACVSTLALGIAASTAMFAVIQGVLLRPLPVREQDRLLVAWKEVRTSGSARYPFGDAEIESVARESQLLEKAAGVTRNGVGRSVLDDRGEPAYAKVALVTGGFFDVLGVRPLAGRTLTTADDRAGAENVVVLSNGFWQRRYGAARDVIGRRVRLDEQPFTIVGVMPPDLDYPAGVEVWRTTSSVPATAPFADASRREVNLIGRVRPGVTLEQASTEITALAGRLDAGAPPGTPRDLVPVVRSFTDVVVGDARGAMLALFSAVCLVLLIATANAANLLLMRGEASRGELALRIALGAGRGRIVRQAIAESFVLTLAAGIAGILGAWWILQGLAALAPDGLPRPESIRLDAAVIFFAGVAVLLTAVLAGAAPAILGTREEVGAQLRATRGATTGSGAFRGRRALVVAQIALAVAVVAAAGLMVRSIARLQAVDLGLPAHDLVLVDLHLPHAKYASRGRHARFLDDAIAQLEGVPAIAAVTPVNLSPFSGQGWDLPGFTAEGQDDDEASTNPSLNIESIHPNYFETFAVPIVSGRAFREADREGSLEVAIVSEDLAARTWPGDTAIGKRLKMGRPSSDGAWYTVVGVARSTRYREVAAPLPTLYLPAAQFQMTATLLVLRSHASLELLTTIARDRIRGVDPDVQVLRVAPFTSMLDRRLARPRFSAWLLAGFAISGLLLSTIGLYAVIAAHVRQRDREIAIRLALGATRTRVGGLVLAEVTRLAGLGALLGLAAATFTNRMLRGMLFEVSPVDPLGMGGASLLIVGAAALASYLPMRRAMRVDAVASLRTH